MARRHVTFLQYGDYREAVNRFSRGDKAVYNAQEHSVSFVASLTEKYDVSVIAVPAERYDERLENGVRAIGLGATGRKQDAVTLLRTLQQLNPTDLILRTPSLPALLWGLGRGKRVLPKFADSFSASGFKNGFLQRSLAYLLNLAVIEVVGNHNIPASLELARIGVDPAKIVPWDWPAQRIPDDQQPKEAPLQGQPFTLFYAGYVSEPKGVGDMIRAVSLLHREGLNVGLEIAGPGEVEDARELAKAEGVSDAIRFLGRIDNDQVSILMRKHDAVVVPSRPSYPEGLPMTIYEGLCSRSPLLISDHPMFVSALAGSPGVSIFRAQDPSSLSASIRELATDPNLYEKLSRDGKLSWESIQVPLKSSQLIGGWLSGSEEDLALLRRYSLKSTGLDSGDRQRVQT